MNVLSKLDQSVNSSNCRIPQPSIINSATRKMNAQFENQENVSSQVMAQQKQMSKGDKQLSQPRGAQSLYQPMIIDNNNFNQKLKINLESSGQTKGLGAAQA